MSQSDAVSLLGVLVAFVGVGLGFWRFRVESGRQEERHRRRVEAERQRRALWEADMQHQVNQIRSEWDGHKAQQARDMNALRESQREAKTATAALRRDMEARDEKLFNGLDRSFRAVSRANIRLAAIAGFLARRFNGGGPIAGWDDTGKIPDISGDISGDEKEEDR